MDMRPDGRHSCEGLSRRYSSCNIQECPAGSKDFRSLQCARFNSVPDNSNRYYSWEPYHHPNSPCELYCAPKGGKFYQRSDTKVIDGTRCRNDGSLDICVAGQCTPVGCDKILGSTKTEDQCGVCGGDGSTCSIVKGVFDEDSFEVGYNDILLIPVGATSILIQKTQPTRNYLSARDTEGRYYFNSNWKIEYPKQLSIGGTAFHYERKPPSSLEPETLRSRGPTTQAFFVVLLYQEKNLGISYEYAVPVAARTPAPDSYLWKTGEFGECSQTCGGGIQHRPVRCVRESDRDIDDERLCDPLTKPDVNATCNNEPCPSNWKVGEWSECSQECGGGTQFRIVYCHQMKDGNTVLVPDEVCDGEKPLFMRSCNVDKECTAWSTGEWSECSVPCGGGERTRMILCFHEKEIVDNSQCDPAEKPFDKETCNMTPCNDGPNNEGGSELENSGDGELMVPCEESVFGCCQDNISPAQGPNYRGCSCKNSRYGCCPDGLTPVLNDKGKGCGCDSTPYGCCADGRTAATSADLSGCPCETLAYGCCPDGHTPARTSDLRNCPCEAHFYGCCLDGRTVARGPNYEGCPCDSTRFGCCQDGRTVAPGPGFEGCPCDSTPHGCCADGYIAAKGPRYEGCPSVQEPKPDVSTEVCRLAKERGPCRNFTIKWFFDLGHGGCSRFWYGGCDGNGNVFDSQEDCEKVCVRPDGPEVCRLPMVAGSCDAKIPSWYFDAGSKMCETFTYGGCLGNNNRFSTKTDCEAKCISRQPPKTDVCLLPHEIGPCNEFRERWYFDYESGQCHKFIFGGCNGNENNFPSYADCEAKCGAKPEPKSEEEDFKADVCGLEKEPGPCLAYFRAWYYDASDSSCKSFIYGGCGGNENRFDKRRDCEQRCIKKPSREPGVLLPEPSTKTANEDICRNPVDPGPCQEEHPRWFYDAQTQNCLHFVYGGCDGNKNRFKTAEICLRFCSGVKAKHGEEVPYVTTAITTTTTTTTTTTIEPPTQCPPSNCAEIRCPYGMEESFDSNGCSSCRCSNPCEVHPCPEGSRCAIDVVRTSGAGVRTEPVCRRVQKSGSCQAVTASSRFQDCETRCRDDAHCRGNHKCCNNGCAYRCMPPADHVSCNKFENSKNLNVVYSNDAKVKSIATFSCVSPYTLVGNHAARCLQNGTWNSTLPSCEASMCSTESLSQSLPELVLPDLKNVTGNFVPYGTELQFLCSPNSFLSGSQKAKCGRQGIWEYGAVRCTQFCVLGEIAPQLSVKPSKEYYLFGEMFTLSCPFLKKPSSDVRRVVCLGTSWSDPIPHCVDAV